MTKITTSKENALAFMKASIKLHITKDRQIYSPVANQYKNEIASYSNFYIESEKENWIAETNKLMECIGNIPDDDWIDYANILENVATIIELLYNKEDINKISEEFKEQGHSGMTMSAVAQKILKYSSQGVYFVDEVIKPITDIECYEHLSKAYNLMISRK